MAQQSNILEYLLLGGAAYLAYSYFTAPSTAVAAAAPPASPPAGGTTGTTSTTTSTGGTSTTSSTPATTQFSGPADLTPSGIALTLQLANQTATPSSPPQYNIDQWSALYAQATGTPITGAQITSMLAAANASGANRSYVLMSPGQYVQLLANAGGVTGLSGVGYRRRISAPVVLVPARGKGFGGYTLGDLRCAAQGGR